MRVRSSVKCMSQVYCQMRVTSLVSKVCKKLNVKKCVTSKVSNECQTQCKVCVTSFVSNACHKVSVKSVSEVQCQKCVTSSVSRVCHKLRFKSVSSLVSKVCHNFDWCQKCVKPEVCYLLFIGSFCLLILLIALRCKTDK